MADEYARPVALGVKTGPREVALMLSGAARVVTVARDTSSPR